MTFAEQEGQGCLSPLQSNTADILSEKLSSCRSASDATLSQEQSFLPVKYRVHHSYIWLGGVQISIASFIALFISVFSAFADIAVVSANIRNTSVFILVIVISCTVFIGMFGIILLMRWWSYRHLYYEIDAQEFNLYSGVFNKKHTHIPYQRIQSINQKATLLQRILGVCSVSIDTAGGAANKAVLVPYLQKMQAEKLRRELFTRKHYALANLAYPTSAKGVKQSALNASCLEDFLPHISDISHSGFNVSVSSDMAANVLDMPAEILNDIRGVFGGDGVDTGTVTYEYGLSNKELIFTGLSNNTVSAVAILGIVGVLSQVAMPLFMMFNPVIKGGLRLFDGEILAVAVLGLVPIGLFIWAMSALGVCLSYGGFRAVRRGSRIEVEQGLLQHRFQSVDIDRIQSVVVRQGFIRRLIGYCELSVSRIDAAQTSSNGQRSNACAGMIIHPFVKLNHVSEILAGILPEFGDVPLEVKPVAPVALRRALIRRCILQGSGFWLALCIAVGHGALFFFTYPGVTVSMTFINFVNVAAILGYAFCAALLILNAISAYLWFRESGFSYNEHFMQISNGGFTRETMNFPRNKIQFGYTKTNPFQRLAHTATIQVRTAAGIGGVTLRLIDVSAENAKEWLEWIKPRKSVTQ